MKTFEDQYSKTWEVHTYGAGASGKADGPPPEGQRMIAFHHPSRGDAEETFTTELDTGQALGDLSDDDLRGLLAIAQDSEE